MLGPASDPTTPMLGPASDLTTLFYLFYLLRLDFSFTDIPTQALKKSHLRGLKFEFFI